MLAMADLLFTDFDHLPVRNVFTAIATAHATIRECHRSPVPDPDHVERLARELLRPGCMTPLHIPNDTRPEHPAPARRPRREEVRRRLLAAASETFLEKGYLDSTLDDIARRAELSKGAVYSNFDSKQEIVGLLLEKRTDRMREVIATATDPTTKDEGRTSASVMTDNLRADADWTQLVLEFASRAGRDAAVRKIYTPFLRAQREEVTCAIARAMADSSPQNYDCAALVATIIVALRNGLALAHAADPEQIDAWVIERALGTVLTLL